jgi:hypothetical protein
MVRQVGLHLVSKLRDNSALYFPYDGPSLPDTFPVLRHID